MIYLVYKQKERLKMNDKKLTASDLFFNLYQDGTEKEAEEFLQKFPYFQDVFTAKELSKDFQDRV